MFLVQGQKRRDVVGVEGWGIPGVSPIASQLGVGECRELPSGGFFKTCGILS